MSSNKGSPAVLHAFTALGGSSLYVTRLVVAEALGVLTRMLREGGINYAGYTRARSDLAGHLGSRFSIVRVEEDLLDDAIALIDKQRSRGAGTLDLIHLASAEYLQSATPGRTIRFMCSDGKLKSVALLRGFDVFDPETDPVTRLSPPSLRLN